MIASIVFWGNFLKHRLLYLKIWASERWFWLLSEQPLPDFRGSGSVKRAVSSNGRVGYLVLFGIHILDENDLVV